MKKLFLILTFCLFAHAGIGQSLGLDNFPVVTRYGPANYRVSASDSEIPISISVDKHTKSINPFNTIPNDPLGTIVFLDKATTATVTTLVRKDSLSYYRYSIQEDNTMLISDAKLTKVDFAWPSNSSHPGYLTVNLGISNVVNKKLTIKIYRLPEADQVTTLIVYNRPLKSAQITRKAISIRDNINKNIDGYHFTHRYNTIIFENDTAFSVTDKTQRLFLTIKKTDLNFIYYVYVVYKGEYRSVSGNWGYGRGDLFFIIDKSYFNQLGDYKVIIATKIKPDDPIRNNLVTQFSFTVRPPEKLYYKYLLLGCLSTGLVAVIIFLLIRKNSRKKLRVANQQMESAKSELNIVRAQLNPHFVFNALSGIQNLMNKDEVEMANNYLNKFARLTRQVLDDKSLISIKDEMSLLEDYLAMEQLRFPFSYKLHADQSDNFLHTEIPAMLLQPFVENAVKHGVSQLKSDGKIIVSFVKQDKQLVLTVTDNGNGFNVAENFDGFGLKLSRKRIALLNDIYKECPISLEMSSKPSNTTIKIILAQWL